MVKPATILGHDEFKKFPDSIGKEDSQHQFMNNHNVQIPPCGNFQTFSETYMLFKVALFVHLIFVPDI